MRVFRFALMACAASLLCAAPVRDPGLAKAQAALERLPLRFEANLGQWIPTVRYAARASGYSLLFTGAGPTIAIGGSQRVDISLLGSNPAAEIQPLEKQSVHTNYFVGARERWRSDVPTYSRVVYRQVYPGIDVVYYGTRESLEYDFTVAPGADPSNIRLRFQGADRVSITPEGDLLVEAAGRRMVQKRPLLYQAGVSGAARSEIPGRYAMLGDNLIGFSVGRYDATRPLVIDPFLVYSTYIGGSGTDEIDAIKTDSHGYLYMVGYTTTSDLVATLGAWWSTNFGAAGTADLLIRKAPVRDTAISRCQSARSRSTTDPSVDGAAALLISASSRPNAARVAATAAAAEPGSVTSQAIAMAPPPASAAMASAPA